MLDEMGKKSTIAVINQKGELVNYHSNQFSNSNVHFGSSNLIIDLDPQGNATTV